MLTRARARISTPWTVTKNEFGYIILELAKELDQIDINPSVKSAAAAGGPM